MKELRPAGISDTAGANAFLPGFMAQYNARFGKPPRSQEEAHRPISPETPLVDVFAWNLYCRPTAPFMPIPLQSRS